MNNNIINGDNPFVDIANDDFNLVFCSPAVEGGNTFRYANASTSLDYLGNSRLANNSIDIGALEYQDFVPNSGILSGAIALYPNDPVTYTTDGTAGGTWSTKEGYVSIDANGVATASVGNYGSTEVIYYTLDVNGCIFQSEFSVTIQEPEINPTLNVLYVDKNAVGSRQTGSSWADALPELADALIWAKQNSSNFYEEDRLQIFVAEGSYSPLYSAQVTNFGLDKGAENTFLLVPYTEIYGGFSPSNNAVDLATRDWHEYPTILDGNNSTYHIIMAMSSSNESVVDGFVIQNANGNGNNYLYDGSFRVNHFFGSAIYTYNSNIVIRNNWFKDNVANYNGNSNGTIFASSSKISLLNNIFSNNSAQKSTALYVENITNGLNIINNTFYNGTDESTIIQYRNVVGGVMANNIFYGAGEDLVLAEVGNYIKLYNNYLSISSWGGNFR